MTLAMGSNVATLSHLLQFGKLVTFKYCVKGFKLEEEHTFGRCGITHLQYPGPNV